VQSPGPQIRQLTFEGKRSALQLKGSGNIVDHNLQALLAIGISAALCLVTWIWARHGEAGVFHGKDN
jgi:hypothetical protein